jgi:sugar lactone lactonase YvrE
MSETAFNDYAPGDLFVAITALDDPADDHAGKARIDRYDVHLRLRASLALPNTTHLVGGLNFDRDGVLWAFDSQGFKVLNVLRDGHVVVRREFAQRAFSHVNFAPDGSLLFGEHLVGDSIRPEVAARMHTKLAPMPGSARFGDGHVFRYAQDGRLLAEYATETHGGMAGFLGVTNSALAPDGRTLVYLSETGQRLMRYDLVDGRQLPDLQSFTPPFPPGPPPMFFAVDFAPDGTLYVLRSGAIHVLDAAGQSTRNIPLAGPGWALMRLADAGTAAFVANFFTGEVAKIALGDGARLGSFQTGAVRSLAGLAQYGRGTFSQ